MMPESTSELPLPPKTSQSRLRISFLRFSLRTLMLLVTLSCFAVWGKLQYDWRCKVALAAKWVEPLVKAQPIGPVGPLGLVYWGLPNQIPPTPAEIKSQQEPEFLEIAILHLPEPKQRLCGLKILVETRKEAARPLLPKLLDKSRHPDTKAVLIRFIGLGRQESSLAKLMPYLEDRDSGVRAAATEALGFIRQPSYEVPMGHSGWGGQPVYFSSEPPIDVGPLRAFPTTPQEFPATSKIAVPDDLRGKLEAMMLTGPTEEERTASARALLAWPPEKYSLRMAEWGVWIEDAGQLKLVQSVLDEIPPFVHQTGNSADSLADRVQQIMVVTKPIVHLTADKPLVVDMEILIREGRPWYAYPRPDDFTLGTSEQRMTAPRLTIESGGNDRVSEPEAPILAPPQEDRRLGSLSALSEGYPWILPNHRLVGTTHGFGWPGENIITSLGLRWQSIIVTPEKYSWMSLPEVGSDPRYAWWKSLREVPSSWVTSQGETERFLYYDGPTRAAAPIAPCFDGRQLTIVTQPICSDGSSPQDTNTRGTSNSLPPRTGFLIRVKHKEIAAREFEIPGGPGQTVIVDVTKPDERSGDEVITRFADLLMEAGLTKGEAGGLIASWRHQFFETPGTRLLTILTRQDYDEMCPLSIRPTPTATARAGIVLSELTAD